MIIDISIPFSYTPKFYQERLQRLVRKVYLHMSRGHGSKMTFYESCDRIVLPCPICRAKKSNFPFPIELIVLFSVHLCSILYISYPYSLCKIDQTYLPSTQSFEKNTDLQSHYYILGAQKKRLIETGFLSTKNIRGHIFWLKIIEGKIPIFFYISTVKALQWYYLL